MTFSSSQFSHERRIRCPFCQELMQVAKVYFYSAEKNYWSCHACDNRACKLDYYQMHSNLYTLCLKDDDQSFVSVAMVVPYQQELYFLSISQEPPFSWVEKVDRSYSRFFKPNIEIHQALPFDRHNPLESAHKAIERLLKLAVFQ